MKAIHYRRYGPPDVLELVDLDPPPVGDDDVLVRVRTTSVNPLEAHLMRGEPYLVRAVMGLPRPRTGRLGADLAGVVEAVGRNVTTYRAGDEVFGYGTGTWAEYVALRADGVLLPKPERLTFEQAGAVGIAAFTALQALRKKAGVRAGQHVLVNGASGGVGTFTVQVAKALGAEVTGVCSTRNVELVRSIGADHVVDYTAENFTAGEPRYDAVIDIAGSRTPSEIKRVLTRKGVLVSVGGPIKGMWVSPLTGPLTLAVRSLFGSQTLTPMLAKGNLADLEVLRDLLAAGTVTPVVDRTFPLADAAAAIRYLEDEHARGKVVLTV
ncbi:NAD(P)-dependent alcohol dehydrogenase [Actinophytocola xanthii]|uniref:Alcohol dehydrogenase n=1 Tax=Actinophytocola xanthii TaxID=1912961 RepID=A0A1Q8CSG6_9PSEU|nr:NAD(P)-dependent alcohol dehydrogenase [Actinophytocola xanthii]OLF17286.1 alcohol dehydrogenase [Actinophytocola xanthii]